MTVGVQPQAHAMLASTFNTLSIASVPQLVASAVGVNQNAHPVSASSEGMTANSLN
jgi:hypothetical protein